MMTKETQIIIYITKLNPQFKKKHQINNKQKLI